MAESLRRLGLATTNPGKLREFKDLLGPLNFALQSAPQDFEVAETGQTFVDNALLKAWALVRHAHIACVADDSGLVVDALGGAPGLYSARYSGETNPALRDSANRALLLREMQCVPAANRAARFICVIAYAAPGGKQHTFEGRLEGRIAMGEQGDGGFGYDAIFIPNGQSLSMAQVPRDVRYRISHRAQALAKLQAWLAALKN